MTCLGFIMGEGRWVRCLKYLRDSCTHGLSKFLAYYIMTIILLNNNVLLTKELEPSIKSTIM